MGTVAETQLDKEKPVQREAAWTLLANILVFKILNINIQIQHGHKLNILVGFIFFSKIAKDSYDHSTCQQESDLSNTQWSTFFEYYRNKLCFSITNSYLKIIM